MSGDRRRADDVDKGRSRAKAVAWSLEEIVAGMSQEKAAGVKPRKFRAPTRQARDEGEPLFRRLAVRRRH